MRRRAEDVGHLAGELTAALAVVDYAVELRAIDVGRRWQAKVDRLESRLPAEVVAEVRRHHQDNVRAPRSVDRG